MAAVIRCVRVFSDRHNPPNSYNSHKRLSLVFEYYILEECTQVKTGMQSFFAKQVGLFELGDRQRNDGTFLSLTNRQICHVFQTTLKKFPISLRFIRCRPELIRWYAPCISIGGLYAAKVDPGQRLSEKYLSIISD